MFLTSINTYHHIFRFRKFTNCLQKADGRTRIGTLFYRADKAGIRLKQAVQQKAENPKGTHSFAQVAQPCAKEEQKDEKDSIITCNNDNNIMNINNIDNNNQYNLMKEEVINAQGCASAQTAQTAAPQTFTTGEYRQTAMKCSPNPDSARTLSEQLHQQVQSGAAHGHRPLPRTEKNRFYNELYG